MSLAVAFEPDVPVSNPPTPARRGPTVGPMAEPSARRAVRRWSLWLGAPAAIISGAWALGLDRAFVAVGLLYASVIVIRLAEAWGDLDLARRQAGGESLPERRGRRPRRTGRAGRSRA